MVLNTHNHWLNLTAGVLRLLEFESPYKVFWLSKVRAPQSCGKLAKALCGEVENYFGIFTIIAYFE
jgi:hypothetical protein